MTSPARAAYGPFASQFANALHNSAPVVVFDHVGIAEALRDCASRRFGDEPFLVRAVLQREYALRADALLPSILASVSGTDERRVAIEQAYDGTLGVNGRPIASIAVYEPHALRLMQAAVRLSDGLLVSSEAERRRVCELLSVDPRVAFAVPERTVPSPEPAQEARSSVVIWAPHLPGDVALQYVLALSDLRFPLQLVSATAPRDNQQSWFAPDRAASALSGAKVVVDVSPFGCEAAAGLCDWNVAIVCDVESGAAEMLDGVRCYDRRRFGSIFEAVIAAVGMGPSRRRAESRSASEPLRRNPLALDGPRVSVLVPTLDRPAMLRDALESVARQSYKNVETVVVVDGGPRLDDLAAAFPAATFLHMPENNPVLSSNTAFAATTGKYVTLLSDDDVFFPDHVAELVSALERSGAAIAHGDVLTAFLRDCDEGWEMYGLESNMSRSAEAGALLVSNQVGAVGVMFRRDAAGTEAPFDDSIPFCRDYALWLKLAERSDLIHVERITSCYTIRNRGAQQQSVMWAGGTLEGYRALYARYPVTDRPVLAQRREQILQSISRGHMGLAAEPASEIAPVPWPLWRS